MISQRAENISFAIDPSASLSCSSGINLFTHGDLLDTEHDAYGLPSGENQLVYASISHRKRGCTFHPDEDPSILAENGWITKALEPVQESSPDECAWHDCVPTWLLTRCKIPIHTFL